MQTTADLVRAAKAGDKSAFAELVRRYERSALVTAYAVLSDMHLAQDAVQEGFVTTYRKLADLREPAAFGPWLLQIVRRQAVATSKKPLPNSHPCLDEMATPPDTDLWTSHLSDVAQQIARLPEHERSVVLLRYLGGHTVAEVARLTGRPVGTVTKQISRALDRLRSWLSEVPS